MGKPKKGKKSQQDDGFGDDVEVDLLAGGASDEEEGIAKPVAKQPSKGKKKKKDADWEEDISDNIEALSLEEDSVTNGKKKQDKKGKQQLPVDDDSEDDEEEDILELSGVGGKKKGMSAFQMLDMEDDSDEEEEEEEEVPKTVQKNKTKKQDSLDDEDENAEISVESTQTAASKKKAKKGGKQEKKKTEEEDIDALLAELDKPAEKGKKGKKKKQADGEEEPVTTEKDQEMDSPGIDITNMTQEEIAKMFDVDDDEEVDLGKKKKKKEKKKKGKQKQAADEEEEMDVDKDEVKEDEGKEDEGKEEEEEESAGTMKTAAQKKKEKKERQKLQKLQEKERGKKGGKPAEEGEKKEAAADEKAAVVEAKEGGDDAAASDKEEGDDEGGKKKKDKKKKKGKEKEEEKKKKPAKGQLKAMQEALQKLKDEEERLKQKEEDEEKRREETRKHKEEEERVSREKKDREKEKRRQKIERQKAEGKFMTAKQKEAHRRALQMLEAMKAQGVDVPHPGEHKKRVVYGKKKKKSHDTEEAQEYSPTEESTSEPPTPETPGVDDKHLLGEAVESGVEEGKESWEEEEDVKDAWDASSGEEEEDEQPPEQEKKEKDVGKVEKKELRKSESKDEEEDEEDDDEEEEDESEDEDEEDESSEEESSDEEESEDEDDGLTPHERAIEKTRAKMQKRRQEAETRRTTDILRAPVVCVLGHVDTGKTTILDKLRRTNVQDGEAGGITQQIGATNVPESAIKDQTKMCKEFAKKELRIPGLLIIDTPGHESFSNLRSRGSSLCDIAILVVDLMHGLEPQTIESLNLLRKRKTPFIVALNKIDRLFQWQSNPHNDIVNTIKKQKPNTKLEFDERVQSIIVQFAEQGLNAALFYENKNPREYISMVPTSGVSGDGMGNLIALIVELTQTMLAKRLTYCDELEAITMEVKAIHGLGTTIDVILVNGMLHEGDTVVLAGTEGPIVTQIRGLLMPQPMRELRVKSAYQHMKEVQAAQGVKIIAKDLEKGLAGLPMYVPRSQDEIDVYKEDVEAALENVLGSIKVQERGVFVQASTLGSLEALLEFLKTSKIPYAGINIGPVHKKDIMKASIMLEHDSQWAVILAFDVKVEREAQELADSLGVQIFTADIIYHLFDRFIAHREALKKRKQEEFKHIAVFPARLRIMPQFVFNTRDPIVCGVVIEAGFIKEGTPVCVPSKQFLEIGRITSIENNHKQVDMARKGQEVCIKIESVPGEAPKLFGRHFDETDLLVSKISRQSIDVVKEYFRDEMQKSDWQLIMELKKQFQIL